MKLWLVRHGETEMNHDGNASADMIRGWRDIPLNDNGRETAHKTGVQLRGKGIQLIESSNLSRARETAQIVGQIIGIQPVFSVGLRPWNLGNLTGTSTESAIPKIKAYVQQPDVAIPGGESFNAFKQRAFTTIADAVQRAGDRLLCLVTHHRVERLLKAWLAAGQPSDHDKIDLSVFTEKGESPGHAEILEIEPARLMGMRGGNVRHAVGSAIGELAAR